MEFLFWIKKLLMEYEIIVSILVFGFFSMLADFYSDLGNNDFAAKVRSTGLLIFLLIFGVDLVLRHMPNPFMIPVMFTEEVEKSTSRNMFDKFIQSDKKLNSSSKMLEKISKIKLDDSILRLDRYNPRNSSEAKDWISSWDELLREWESIDRELMEKPFSDEGFRYHIFPHVALPLAFALGASVNLRRPLVLYHRQNQDKFCKVIDLKDPREVIYKPEVYVATPETMPENLNDLKGGSKLILHIVISAHHPENFQLHEDYLNATNAAIVYRSDLNPNDDWLPYVQEIFGIAMPIVNRFEKVELCLICPSVIAFALGMAFSRKGSLEVCHHCCDDKYRPIFPLSEIERRPHFS